MRHAHDAGLPSSSALKRAPHLPLQQPEVLLQQVLLRKTASFPLIVCNLLHKCPALLSGTAQEAVLIGKQIGLVEQAGCVSPPCSAEALSQFSPFLLLDNNLEAMCLDTVHAELRSSDPMSKSPKCDGVMQQTQHTCTMDSAQCGCLPQEEVDTLSLQHGAPCLRLLAAKISKCHRSMHHTV